MGTGLLGSKKLTLALALTDDNFFGVFHSGVQVLHQEGSIKRQASIILAPPPSLLSPTVGGSSAVTPMSGSGTAPTRNAHFGASAGGTAAAPAVGAGRMAGSSEGRSPASFMSPKEPDPKRAQVGVQAQAVARPTYDRSSLISDEKGQARPADIEDASEEGEVAPSPRYDASHSMR